MGMLVVRPSRDEGTYRSMSNHRYSKFWWQDWQRDGALRMCSLAARGLWMDILCLAHDGIPTGHVTVNGKAPSNRQLAAIVGATEKEAVKLLAELEDAGVFSRTEDGVIFSRRMVRDAALSIEGEKNANKRWAKGDNPSGAPNTPPTQGVNGHPAPTPLGDPQATPILNRSESESESEPERHLQKEDNLSSFNRNSRAQGDVETSEQPSPIEKALAGVVTDIRKVMRPTAYPPRKPIRDVQEQTAAVEPPRRPRTSHLSPDQLAAARRRAP
jgi:hypothetical protein